MTQVQHKTGRGIYDLPYHHAMLDDGESVTVVIDQYCGQDDIGGGMYRPQAYRVTGSAARAVRNWWSGGPSETLNPGPATLDEVMHIYAEDLYAGTLGAVPEWAR